MPKKLRPPKSNIKSGAVEKTGRARKNPIANLGNYAHAEKASYGERNTAHRNPFKTMKTRKDY
jgi:hypothetical protein